MSRTSVVPFETITTQIRVIRGQKVLLDRDLHAALRSQNVILDKGRGRYSKYPPLVFTEQGVGMLSSVLRSPRAVQVNIAIVRAFVELRRFALTHEELRSRLDTLERKTGRGFRAVFVALRKLTEPQPPLKPTLGFARKKVG